MTLDEMQKAAESTLALESQDAPQAMRMARLCARATLTLLSRLREAEGLLVQAATDAKHPEHGNGQRAYDAVSAYFAKHGGK